MKGPLGEKKRKNRETRSLSRHNLLSLSFRKPVPANLFYGPKDSSSSSSSSSLSSSLSCFLSSSFQAKKPKERDEEGHSDLDEKTGKTCRTALSSSSSSFSFSCSNLKENEIFWRKVSRALRGKSTVFLPPGQQRSTSSSSSSSSLSSPWLLSSSEGPPFLLSSPRCDIASLHGSLSVSPFLHTDERSEKKKETNKEDQQAFLPRGFSDSSFPRLRVQIFQKQALALAFLQNLSSFRTPPENRRRKSSSFHSTLHRYRHDSNEAGDKENRGTGDREIRSIEDKENRLWVRKGPEINRGSDDEEDKRWREDREENRRREEREERRWIEEQENVSSLFGLFAQEVSQGGLRRYLVVSYRDFITSYLKMIHLGRKRHMYEVLRENCPCWLYFDLEYSKIGNDHSYNSTSSSSSSSLPIKKMMRTANEVKKKEGEEREEREEEVREVGEQEEEEKREQDEEETREKKEEEVMKFFKRMLIQFLKDCFAFSLREEDIIDLDSSTEEKFSRHLIVKGIDRDVEDHHLSMYHPDILWLLREEEKGEKKKKNDSIMRERKKMKERKSKVKTEEEREERSEDDTAKKEEDEKQRKHSTIEDEEKEKKRKRQEKEKGEKEEEEATNRVSGRNLTGEEEGIERECEEEEKNHEKSFRKKMPSSSSTLSSTAPLQEQDTVNLPSISHSSQETSPLSREEEEQSRDLLERKRNGEREPSLESSVSRINDMKEEKDRSKERRRVFSTAFKDTAETGRFVDLFILYLLGELREAKRRARARREKNGLLHGDSDAGRRGEEKRDKGKEDKEEVGEEKRDKGKEDKEEVGEEKRDKGKEDKEEVEIGGMEEERGVWKGVFEREDGLKERKDKHRDDLCFSRIRSEKDKESGEREEEMEKEGEERKERLAQKTEEMRKKEESGETKDERERGEKRKIEEEEEKDEVKRARSSFFSDDYSCAQGLGCARQPREEDEEEGSGEREKETNASKKDEIRERSEEQTIDSVNDESEDIEFLSLFEELEDTHGNKRKNMTSKEEEEREREKEREKEEERRGSTSHEKRQMKEEEEREREKEKDRRRRNLSPCISHRRRSDEVEKEKFQQVSEELLNSSVDTTCTSTAQSSSSFAGRSTSSFSESVKSISQLPKKEEKEEEEKKKRIEEGEGDLSEESYYYSLLSLFPWTSSSSSSSECSADGAKDKRKTPPTRRRACIIDRGVYTRNRCFRILHSSKFNKSAHLEVSSSCLYPLGEDPRLRVLRSLVSLVPPCIPFFSHPPFECTYTSANARTASAEEENSSSSSRLSVNERGSQDKENLSGDTTTQSRGVSLTLEQHLSFLLSTSPSTTKIPCDFFSYILEDITEDKKNVSRQHEHPHLSSSSSVSLGDESPSSSSSFRSLSENSVSVNFFPSLLRESKSFLGSERNEEISKAKTQERPAYLCQLVRYAVRYWDERYQVYIHRKKKTFDTCHQPTKFLSHGRLHSDPTMPTSSFSSSSSSFSVTSHHLYSKERRISSNNANACEGDLFKEPKISDDRGSCSSENRRELSNSSKASTSSTEENLKEKDSKDISIDEREKKEERKPGWELSMDELVRLLKAKKEEDSFLTGEGPKGEMEFTRKVASILFFRDSSTAVVTLQGNRFCERIGRPHKSNAVKLVINVKEGLFYQKCFDIDCSGFRSTPVYFPSYLQNLAESVEELLQAQEVSTEDNADEGKKKEEDLSGGEKEKSVSLSVRQHILSKTQEEIVSGKQEEMTDELQDILNASLE